MTGPVSVPGIPPEVTDETEAFWTAASEGRLVTDRCDDCGAYTFPPRGICRACRSRSVSPAEVTGRGRIYSYTVNYHKWLPDLEVPYTIVIVEFPEHSGIRVVGRLRGEPPPETVIGSEVETGFEAGPGGYSIPSFTLV